MSPDIIKGNTVIETEKYRHKIKYKQMKLTEMKIMQHKDGNFDQKTKWPKYVMNRAQVVKIV